MDASLDLRVIARQYKGERRLYAALANAVENRLRSAALQRGLVCSCSSREKDLTSLLKKMLRKEYQNYDQITDKAGSRVIVSDISELPIAETLIRETFDVLEQTNKTAETGVDRLGYHGIHFLVAMPRGKSIDADGVTESIDGKVCEVQLHTRAESLWNEVSHTLLYKPNQEPPNHVKRRLFRLVALMEIFDDEVAATKRIIAEQPGSESAVILTQLEGPFLRLAGRPFDKELSLEIIESLRTALSVEEREGLGEKLDQFLDDRAEKLSEFFSDHLAINEEENPLVFQPEVILIFQQLERDKFALKERWREEYPFELLDSLATKWGENIGE
jgi:ppGpp synthetase/RelA/SpoT-type nucleotidyltranferase